MKMKLLYSVAIAAGALAATPAAAQVQFTGTTQGCFGGGCTPGVGPTVDSGLTYTAGGFNQTSDNTGYLSIGDILNNLGSFTLAPADGMHSYAGDHFALQINFTQPGFANSLYSALLQGTVTDTNGSVSVNFQDPLTQLVSSTGGMFTVTVPTFVGLTPNNTPVWVSAKFQAAVPEPATWGMMLLGFGAMGMAMRRRRRPVLAQVA